MTTAPPSDGNLQHEAAQAPSWLTQPAPGTGSGLPSVAGVPRRWLVGGGAVVAAVAVVIAISTGSGSSSDTPVDAVQAHVDAFVDGDWEQAYSLLCADEQHDYKDAAYYGKRMEYKYRGALRGAELNGKGRVESDGDYKVGVTLHTVFGDHDVMLDVVHEADGYRVCDNLLG